MDNPMNPSHFQQDPQRASSGRSASAYNPDPQSGSYSLPNDPPYGSIITEGSNFDVFEWHQSYQSCQRYFLDHAQHGGLVQTLAAFLNIRLPFQWTTQPILASNPPPPAAPGLHTHHPQHPSFAGRRPPHPPPGAAIPWVSLVPYIRRLVVTGFDNEGVLHGFFGDDWRKGIGPLQECERRNYLFAAKSVGWAKVKCQYDMSSNETVPFLRPLQNVQLMEIENAEKSWSQWLAMEDWMVGPRAPDAMDERGGAEGGGIGSRPDVGRS